MRGVTLIFFARLDFWGTTALSSAMNAEEGLRNKHLVIEGQYWEPFLMFDHHDSNGSAIEGTSYRGIMWDLLMFMQRARNFTITMVHQAKWGWGSCFSVNNCSGMIGMVNRKEVDLAIGTKEMK